MSETSTEGGEARVSVPALPYVKPWHRIAQTESKLILEYGHSTVVLEGRAVGRLMPILLPLLDGTNDIEKINAQIGEPAAPAVAQALQMLADHGVLSEGPPLPAEAPQPAAETAHFLAAFGEDRTVGQAADLLAGASASVAGGGATAREVSRLLEEAGVPGPGRVEWAGDQQPVDIAVVAPEPEELPELEAWNLRALASGTPWLQVLPFDGRMAVVGPLFVPGETCCFECYRRRRAANLSFPSEDFWALEQTPAPYPTPPPLREIGAGLAATLALRWLSDRAGAGPSSVPARMYALQFGQSIELDSHFVYRVPRCPVCFPDDGGTPTPWHG